MTGENIGDKDREEDYLFVWIDCLRRFLLPDYYDSTLSLLSIGFHAQARFSTLLDTRMPHN